MAAELEDRVEERHVELESDVKHLQADVTDIKGNVGRLQVDVGHLQADVTEIKSNVERLQADVGHLQVNVGQLRSDVGHLQTDVAEIKLDARQFRTEVLARFDKLTDRFEKLSDTVSDLRTQTIRGDLQTRIWMLVLVGTVLAVMAHGFKWI